MKIYVASSWRNEYQQTIVKKLREQGHKVYDFKNPEPGNNGFSWREISPNWQQWSVEEFQNGIKHPIARDGFRKDETAIRECDIVILVLPCGKSAHLEAGFAVGTGKKVFALIPEKIEPELMYSWFDEIYDDFGEMLEDMRNLENAEWMTQSYRDFV